EMPDEDAFSPLESHCSLREATYDGIQGFALMDCDGEMEIFAENRSDVFFYIQEHQLTFRLLN
ncbi:hypothetical protein, partial [Rhizobium sp. RHZ02]|uniref:hypothetical protein n=1 Tax=Rhizobium sp. RHZ02 TaxID=2769306 RepID=UPI001AEE1AC1